jgi:hypothetical protein
MLARSWLYDACAVLHPQKSIELVML